MLLTLLFIIAAGAILGLAFALYSLIALLRDKVPYVTTSPWAITWLKQNARIANHALVVELGCGDARVLRALKQSNPTIRAMGYERNWWPFLLAKLRCCGTGVMIRRENFYQANLRDVAMVFCYLTTRVMPKVELLLRSQLRQGAVVYSYGFRFPTWEPSKIIANPKRHRGATLLLYQIP